MFPRILRPPCFFLGYCYPFDQQLFSSSLAYCWWCRQLFNGFPIDSKKLRLNGVKEYFFPIWEIHWIIAFLASDADTTSVCWSNNLQKCQNIRKQHVFQRKLYLFFKLFLKNYNRQPPRWCCPLSWSALCPRPGMQATYILTSVAYGRVLHKCAEVKLFISSFSIWNTN